MHYPVFLWLYNFSHQSVIFDRMIVFVGNKSDKIVLIIALVFFLVLFLLHKDWKNKKWVSWIKEIIVVVGSVVSAWVVAEIIKVIVKAPRPFIVFPEISPLFLHGGYDSFPSGHATVFFALATTLYQYHKVVGICFFVFAILIALSRVVSGIHFPGDIVVGAIIGIIIGRSVFVMARRILKL